MPLAPRCKCHILIRSNAACHRSESQNPPTTSPKRTFKRRWATQAGRLYLSELGLTSLPESLGKLSSLQSLDLSRQSAHEPAGVARQAEQPAIARPSGNQLMSLPESLGKLSNLNTLFLSAISSRACRVARQAEGPPNAPPLRQSAHEPAGVARQAERPAKALPFPISSKPPDARQAQRCVTF